MAIRWTSAAYGDLQRLHAFLDPVDPAAATQAVRFIVRRIERIPGQPRLGERLPRFGAREVRRVLAGHYEIRYELRGTDVIVLRIFHAREDR